MGSLPLYPTIDSNAVTASVVVKISQPRDVAPTVSGAYPGSRGCTSSNSSKTSRTAINTPPIFLALDNRLRVIEHPVFVHIALRRYESDLHFRGGGPVPKFNLYSFE